MHYWSIIFISHVERSFAHQSGLWIATVTLMMRSESIWALHESVGTESRWVDFHREWDHWTLGCGGSYKKKSPFKDFFLWFFDYNIFWYVLIISLVTWGIYCTYIVVFFTGLPEIRNFLYRSYILAPLCFFTLFSYFLLEKHSVYNI